MHKVYILDRAAKIRYPNRDKIVLRLFDLLPAVVAMEEFTIVKIDFKDYFNSISSPYVFKKYLDAKIQDRATRDLVQRFTKDTLFTYAGLCTSNAIAEIIAQEYDQNVQYLFQDYGLILYDRYVDDCIFIFNRHVSKDDIESKLDEALKRVFHDESVHVSPKCKTRYNKGKTKYISNRLFIRAPQTTQEFDFLGYQFQLTKTRRRVEIAYGITKKKKEKYERRIDHIIYLYTDQNSPDYHNLELLRLRIAAFTSRTVYLEVHSNVPVWKVKGIIANYSQLRYYAKAELLDLDTKSFLKNMVTDALIRAKVPLPYFIRGSFEKSGYNLYYNLLANKSWIFVNHVGYDMKTLKQLCVKAGIDVVKEAKYDSLVRQFLIRIKVGY